MKIFIMLYCLVAILGVSAQNYVEYNTTVNSAKIDIIEFNYDLAIQKMDSIFKIYKPFPNDVFIEAQVLAVTKDFNTTKKCLLLGASVGLGLSCLRYPVFDKFKLDENYLTFKKEFINQKEAYNNSLNKDYRDECIKLVILDQISNKTHKLINRIWPFSAFADKKLNKQDELILKKLDTLIIINNGQLPFRSVVGTRSFTYKSMPKNSDGINELLLSTIFYHYPLAFQKWENHLNEALENGEISARMYALLRTFCGVHKKYSLDRKVKREMKYTDYKYYFRWPELAEEEIIKDVNIERAKIGLYSVEDEKRIKRYQNRFNGFYLKYRDEVKSINPKEDYCISFNYYSL